MDILELMKHPERMDRDTLYELRSEVALYPYHQTVRLLMLQNLYLLHDPSFDEELRRAAVYITDRRVLFNMVEAAHYQLRKPSSSSSASSAPSASESSLNSKFSSLNSQDRTASLIDSFLGSIP